MLGHWKEEPEPWNLDELKEAENLETLESLSVSLANGHCLPSHLRKLTLH